MKGNEYIKHELTYVCSNENMHDFKKEAWDSLKIHMKATGDDILSDTTEDTPVDTILLRLTSATEEGINKFIPTRMTKTKERPPWISLEIRRLLRKQR